MLATQQPGRRENPILTIGNEVNKKNRVPGYATAPFVPVVDGDEHEEELERHHSASWNGLKKMSVGQRGGFKAPT
jgi:hypothetical protein